MKGLQERPAVGDDRELGRLLHENDRALAEALIDSRIALERLFVVLERAREAELGSVLRLPPDGRREREVALRELTDSLDEVRRDHAERRSSDTTLSSVRERALEVLCASPLDSRVITQVLSELELARDRSDAQGRGKLESAIAQIRRAAAAAEAARARLLESNMPLVLWMARRRVNHGLPLSDLVQEGSIGLLRAIEKYDSRREVRFSTYAAWWIRHSINRALSYQSRAIRVPVRLMGIRRRALREAQKFALMYGREPTALELAEQTRLPTAKVSAALTVPEEPLSLELPRHGDSELRLGDSLAAPSVGGPLQALTERDDERNVTGLLQLLKPREQEVLRLRFGLSDGQPHTLAEIGERFGLTRERVRQIEAIALKKLREGAENRPGAGALFPPAKVGYGTTRAARRLPRARTKSRRARSRTR